MATTYEEPKTSTEEPKRTEQEQARLRAFLSKIAGRVYLDIPNDMSDGEFEELRMAMERHCKEVAVRRITTESKLHWTVGLYDCFGNRVGIIISTNLGAFPYGHKKVTITVGNDAWEKTLEDAIELVDEEIADLQGFKEALKETAKQLGLSIMDWDELKSELEEEPKEE
jgi:hypothetical protein